MPTVLEVNGYKFKFFSNENSEPPHVHVGKGGGNAKYWLAPECQEEYSYDFTIRERRDIKKIIIQNNAQLIQKWNEYLANKIVNKRAKDPIDKMIFEKGLKIAQVLPIKKRDSLVVILNNGTVVNVRLSQFPRLKKAEQSQLDAWKLIGNGIGIEWQAIDEDLSLKGLVQQLIFENTLRFVAGGFNYATAT